MPDYKKMYHKLFNAITDSIKILQEAQNDAEKEYIESEPSNLEIHKQMSVNQKDK